MFIHQDGSATLIAGDGLPPIRVETFECDACQDETPFTELWEVLQRRYSSGELCAVLWFCPACGPNEGATLHTEDCEHE
jgi:hypothetical protein